MEKPKYNSGNGFQTSVWGPPLWHFLHIISFNFPVNPSPIQRKQYHDFLMQLQNVLPCKYCRDNFTSNLQSIGYSESVFDSRETFSEFMYSFHEEVNKMLGKSSNVTYKGLRDQYEQFRSKCGGASDKASGALESGCIQPLNENNHKSKCCLVIIPPEQTTRDSIWVSPLLKPKTQGSGGAPPQVRPTQLVYSA